MRLMFVCLGKTPGHQLELIVKYLGTPSKDYIKRTKSDLVKSYILRK